MHATVLVPECPTPKTKAPTVAISGHARMNVAAMAASDFAALAEIVDPDAVMIGAGSAGHLEMYAAAGEGLAPEYRIEISPQEFVMMDQEWAFERGTTIQSWQPEGAEERVEVRNSYLLILRNSDGQWKPYREVASALPPPGGWPAAVGDTHATDRLATLREALVTAGQPC